MKEQTRSAIAYYCQSGRYLSRVPEEYKNRAIEGRYLKRFLDFNGAHLPKTNAGIARHKISVAEYERKYDVTFSDAEFRGLYEAVERYIYAESVMREQEEKAQANSTSSWFSRQKDKLMAAVSAKSRAAQKAQRTVKEADRRIATLKRMIARLERNLKQDQDRVDDLTPKLKLPEYKNSSLYRKLVSARDDAQARVRRYTKELSDRNYQLWVWTNRKSAAEKALGLDTEPTPEPSPPVEPPRPQPQREEAPEPPQPKKPVEVQREWNRKKFSKFCELRSSPPKGASKVVLIWRGEDHQQVRIFADDIDSANEAFAELADRQPVGTPLRIRGKYDYTIEREQYDVVYDG